MILRTAHGSKEYAVEAMRVGARAKNWTSRWTGNPIQKIAGGSEKPLEGKKLIQQIAAMEAISGKESAAILLTGETGTGKEWWRTIHSRAGVPTSRSWR